MSVGPSVEYGWPSFAVMRRLLERVGELQHTEVVSMAADNLEADGKPAR